MIQTMIYDYLGSETDPIYQKLKQLKKGQQIDLGSLTVSLNYAGMYEVTSVDLHDGFSNTESCYQYLLKTIQEYSHACAI
ncbi:hypothetical protein [Ornithinibacillus xuwenensis]|uniref:Uncharacterized protein n=1 Tax=Ornithinibacillus xuwenensis TaxID=3144668 RepID=A0ABU9XBL4_9BACI